MARLNTAISPSTRNSTPATRCNLAQSSTNVRTRSPSSSSDKENNPDPRSQPQTSKDKGKAPMGPPARPQHGTHSTHKRRRLGEHNLRQSQLLDLGEEEEEDDEDNSEPEKLKYYDPNQDAEYRRKLRQDLREQSRQLHDNKDALAQPDNDSLQAYINKSNRLMRKVRQTADAVIESRNLVDIGELALKRTTNMVLGSTGTGIDVDEFVSKCITFMRHGGPLNDDGDSDEEGDASTQNRQKRQARRCTVAEDELEDEGDAMNWEVLGELTCFPNNSRPPVPSFLFGPLSVQKRARALTQRRVRSQRDTQAKETRPENLRAEDLERNENSNLTKLCVGIRDRLTTVLHERTDALENSGIDDMSEEDAIALMKHQRITRKASDGSAALSLFDFAINPNSFGQTVENLFYISFLIKDGGVAVDEDEDGLPTLNPSQARSMEEQREKQISRHQAVFSLDWPTWRKLVQAYDIQEPMIPHRNDEQGTQVTARGWYA
ncbi:Nse4-domain-containing protein [Patellaria atrata CBS 101060]|uniref:Non-structural maintenance of chromosomes element 4 n=1 Tax=Patellaria atrata CBS 101060 TaxID=1346257 RepID=A0A9P4S5W8_9PEZI|nr:Nse4-domain-containing protein [Patellaria atrata CBS 101060]